MHPPPLFQWLDHRAAGVILHATSLPGPGGIGGLGREAHAFVDWLGQCGFSYWQLCPLGPTGFGDSPYQAFSSRAGNTFLIDLRELHEMGLLALDDLAPLHRLPEGRVDYGLQWRLRRPLLQRAAERFRTAADPADRAAWSEFRHRTASWLEDFALFSALRARHEYRPWWTWPPEDRDARRARHRLAEPDLRLQVEAETVLQFLFFRQWCRLRDHARRQGVRILGDVPIFVARDSASAWRRPDLFLFDAEFQPTFVAGVPPDYFSPEGQLWGNPLFDWPRHREEGYAWWMDRLEASFRLYDVVRIDHFRGFDEYWSVPASSTTARLGSWQPGPGLEFFRAVRERFPEARLVAEDLGLVTPGVKRLLRESGLPGMAVLQFAFDGENSDYLPHQLDPNTALYPGTHDNNTTWGWYREQPEKVRDYVRRYLRVSGEAVPWDFVRAGYASVARLFIVALQDLLSLGPEARLNTPGTASGNWQWRVTSGQWQRLHAESGDYLRELATLYERVPKSSAPPAPPVG